MSDSLDSNAGKKKFVRSSESLAFERMWLDLPCNGLIPERVSFRPSLARTFLRHVVLAQLPSPSEPGLRLRVVGDAILQQVQGNLVGMNYLDFLEDEMHRAFALERVGELFEKPCGHRWVAPVDYERAFSQYWEITAFPLAAGEQATATVVGLVRPLDLIADGTRAERKIVRIRRAVQFDVLEIRR